MSSADFVNGLLDAVLELGHVWVMAGLRKGSVMARQLPLWRSSLFVPVNIDRFVDKAHERDADAIVLDLEDSIAATEKAAARDLIGDGARKVSRRGADVIVRVNRSWRMAIKDLESAALGEVAAIMVPKVADAAHVRSIGEVLDELEQERGIPASRRPAAHRAACSEARAE